MARQCNVDVKDRREAVLCLLRREEVAAVIARRIGVKKRTASPYPVPPLSRSGGAFLSTDATTTKVRRLQPRRPSWQLDSRFMTATWVDSNLRHH